MKMPKYTITSLTLVGTNISCVACSTTESFATKLILPAKYSLPPQHFWVPDYSTNVDLDTELIPLTFSRKL